MYIRSDRLIVALDIPNMGWASYNRFDRTGAVASVVLDGKHTFAAPESLSSEIFTTGGLGLMSEFVWEEAVAAAKVGERFHKIGVGMLTRAEEEVNIRSAHFFPCEAYKATCDQDGPQAAVFTSKAPMLGGWEFLLTRRARVEGNVLSIESTLANLGDKPMNLMEFNHNFVNIDDLPAGPDYTIELSYPLALDKEPAGVIRQNGNLYTFTDIPERPFFIATNGVGDAACYGWKMKNAKSPATIAEQVSKRPCRTQIWGLAHVLSPEVFLPLSIEPGNSETWTRRWTFDC